LSVVQDLPEKIGKFKLFPVQYTPPAETTDMDHPLVLTIEKNVFSDGVLSEKVEGLRALREKDCVYINHKDADDFEITEGEVVRIVSRHGSVETEARITKSTPAGLAVANLEPAKINQILNPVLDTISRTPEMKICAVRLEKIRKGGKMRKKREVAGIL
jgi:predicted molibdopterin-dependent oxidoreductase YjgC